MKNIVYEYMYWVQTFFKLTDNWLLFNPLNILQLWPYSGLSGTTQHPSVNHQHRQDGRGHHQDIHL